jgi:hypothetical protein
LNGSGKLGEIVENCRYSATNNWINLTSVYTQKGETFMSKKQLRRIGKSEILAYGKIGFSSHGNYSNDVVTLYHNITNHTPKDVYVDWHPYTNRHVKRKDSWTNKTELSLKGLNGVLHKPMSVMTNAKVTIDGLSTNIEDVPIYLTTSKSLVVFITKIPKAVIEGAKFVVRHFIGGNSPGVILTAEATQLDESLFNYRYTATAEGNTPYLVRWGHFPTEVLVREPGAEVVIANFRASGLVGLLNEYAVMTHEVGGRPDITLAPMPFPRQRDSVRGLRELSLLAHVYTTEYLETT